MPLLRLQLLLAACLTGLIWTVQLVHYPSFDYVAEEMFSAFHAHHTGSITIVVLPLMLAELAAGAYAWWQSGWARTPGLLLGMVVLIWASTFGLSVPLHETLGTAGKDSAVIDRLVRTNWPRTLLWTLRLGWLWLLATNFRQQ